MDHDDDTRSGNGRFDSDPDPDDLDDEAPLEAGEEAAATLAATAGTDESLPERVAAAIGDLPGVERAPDGEAVTFLVGGRPFAVLVPDALEVRLDPRVAAAALRTADTTASARGAGWIRFAPASIDRFALDRADAWVRSAHARASGA